MRKLFIFIGLILVVSSCKKDKYCGENVENDASVDIFYGKITSCNPIDPSGDFELYFKNEEEYFNDTSCNRQPIPIPLDFEGVILAQGVKVSYVGPNGGDPGYSLDVAIKKDTCDKFIDFKFILTTIDTSRVLEYNKNVIVLLNGVDSTYTVNFSHEIIPYKE